MTQKTEIDTAAVWRDFGSRLRAYLRGRLAAEADVNDLLQTIFTRIHASAGDQTEIRNVSGWVFQITRNALIDHHRARAREASVTTELKDAADGSVDSSLATGADDDSEMAPRAALARCLEPLLTRLPPSYGQAVSMTDLQGLSQAAAAERVGLSLSAMKSRVQRGRRQLKELLLACCEVELDARRGVADFEPRAGDDCTCC